MRNFALTAVAAAFILSGSVMYMSDQTADTGNSFQKFSSEKEFRQFVSDSGAEALQGGPGGIQEQVRATADFSSGAGGSYSLKVERSSSTNTQVSGVGEPDILKNAGERLYYSPEESYFYGASNPNTSIFQTLPAENFSETSEIPVNGRMFLTEDSIISLGKNITAFDRDTHEKIWQEELNASIEAARKINGSLYLVLSKSIRSEDPCPVRPLDSTIMPCTSFYHAENGEADTTYTLVKMDKTTGEVLKTNGFTGSRSNSVIYVSRNSIYLTYSDTVSETKILVNFLNSQGSRYLDSETMNRIEELQGYDIGDQSLRNEIQRAIRKYLSGLESDRRQEVEESLENALGNYTAERKRELTTTSIAKFNLDLELEAQGQVPGEVNNRFSLDQSSQGLRIATTVGDSWNFDTKPENDLYTLNRDLEISGSVKGMGLNERIYSVRYVGDKAYVVTYRRVDPFHMIDVSDHKNPELEGTLKLPGFSSYLHPLQEDRILGIGEENGSVKIVIFDVSGDEPEIVDSKVLDDYYSSISDSHHAFQIDRQNKVFFLPGSQGGHFFSYNHSLEEKHFVNISGVQRGAFVNQNFYIFGEENASVVDMKNWETVKEIQFRNISRPEPVPLPGPVIEK
ncbi:MAG: beta-propeller domain-containing protein [Candidatus Nanosalina sp.]